MDSTDIKRGDFAVVEPGYLTSRRCRVVGPGPDGHLYVAMIDWPEEPHILVARERLIPRPNGFLDPAGSIDPSAGPASGIPVADVAPASAPG